jgi:hypothetical protein
MNCIMHFFSHSQSVLSCIAQGYCDMIMAPTEVFISHRGPDTKRNFAVWLLSELRRKSVSCFLDERSFELGDSASDAIAAELIAAKVVILVLSKDFFGSPHCMEELHQSRVQEKAVIPVFFAINFEDCKPGHLIESLGEVDWSRFKGGRAAWEEDVSWVTGNVGLRLEASDGFWDTCIVRITEGVGKLLKRPLQDIGSKVFEVPFTRNTGFVGREASLRELQVRLEQDGVAYVNGMGGIGKTEVLLEYAYRKKEFFTKVLWVDGSSQSLVPNYLKLAEHLGVTMDRRGGDELSRNVLSLGKEEKEPSQEDNIRAVREALEKSEVPCLLLLDSVETAEGLLQLLPKYGPCQVSELSSPFPKEHSSAASALSGRSKMMPTAITHCTLICVGCIPEVD